MEWTLEEDDEYSEWRWSDGVMSNFSRNWGLLMVGICYGSSCLVVESVCWLPARRAAGNWVANQLDVVEAMALALNVTINEVHDVLEEVPGLVTTTSRGEGRCTRSLKELTTLE